MPLTWNVDQYISSLRRRMQATQRGVQQATASAAGEVFRKTVEETAVETGRARSSWQLVPINPWTWMIISEGVPYILILEFGGYRSVGPKTVQTGEGIFSRQSPRGMLRISLMAVRDAYQQDLKIALQTGWMAA